MTREEKTQVIAELRQALSHASAFYLVDIGGMNADDTAAFRRRLYEKGLRIRMVKNALLAKAISATEHIALDPLAPALQGPTAIILCGEDPKVPAQVVEAFQKDKQKSLPAFKAAWIEGEVFVGADQLEALPRRKAKSELLGELVVRLQSPIQRVLGALKGSGETLAGLLKTLSEKSS